MRPRPSHEFFVCPHCGAELPLDAEFCRECGADEEHGWNEDFTGETDLSDSGSEGDDSFNYDEFIAREFPDQAPRPTMRVRLWRLIVAIVIAAFLLWYLA